MSSWNLKPGGSGGGSSEKPPAGNHPATLVAIIDMGEQWQEAFKPGDKSYWARRAYFVWELTSEKKSGTDKNHVIAIDLTMSLGEKSKLRKFIEARTGKKLPQDSGYDILAELGQPCLLNVVEKNGYPKIDGVSALPKGFPATQPTYPLTAITLDEFVKGEAIPDWVPWLYGRNLGDHIRESKQIAGDTKTAQVPNPF